MAVIGLQSAIWSNRFKTTVLLVFFPVFLFAIVFLAEYGFARYNDAVASYRVSTGISQAVPAQKEASPMQTSLAAFSETLSVFTYLGPVILIWALVSFYFHRQLIFKFSGARAIERKSHPELFNLVENLCISRGIPTPNIGILDDSSLNAFALGWKPKNAWIVFSQGILDKLDTAEIEAVAAHELTHIFNKDGLLLATTIVYIGAIAALGEMLLRAGSWNSSGSNKKGNPHLLILGLALLILGYLILPLVQRAISRKREYLADAGSVQLTKNKEAMISALLKISENSTIESIKKDSLSALCISNPFPKNGSQSIFMETVHDFFSTHPSIEDRVIMLNKY